MAQAKPSTDKTSRTIKQPTSDRNAPKIRPNSEANRDQLAQDTGPEAPMPDGAVTHTPGS